MKCEMPIMSGIATAPAIRKTRQLHSYTGLRDIEVQGTPAKSYLPGGLFRNKHSQKVV